MGYHRQNFQKRLHNVHRHPSLTCHSPTCMQQLVAVMSVSPIPCLQLAKSHQFPTFFALFPMIAQLVSDSELIHPNLWRKSACSFLDDCLARTLCLMYLAGLIVTHMGYGQELRFGRRGCGFVVEGSSLVEARRIPSAVVEVPRTPSAAELPHRVRAGPHMVPEGLLPHHLYRYPSQRHMMEGVHSLAGDCKQEL